MTHQLITEIFAAAFDNAYLGELDDSAILKFSRDEYAYTTDSYVIDPVFFPGGDIGKLAVCGTVNDLASCAAEPLYLTAGFILEEGLAFDVLRRVVASMAREARRSRVKIVAGDTKVVPKGKADKLFINTSGIGIVRKRLKMSDIRPTDKILINGPIAEHGLSVLLSRQRFSYKGGIKSDCNSLWDIVKLLLQARVAVRFMRDATRGGVSAVANEVALGCRRSLLFFENKIPLRPSARYLCEMLGLEPLDVANEGKMVIFVAAEDAAKALSVLKKHPLGRHAAVIGEVRRERTPRVFLKTSVGGEKILGYPLTEPIPRIC